MSILLDTDLLSLLERKRIPGKLATWMNGQTDVVISVVSLAELEFGLQQSPAGHRAALAEWLSDTRRRFAPVTEQLSEPILVRWKRLLADLKRNNRTMTCEDSLIAATALYWGHTVATRNTRHFQPAGVPVIDPLAA
ncbi:MAG TPA: PIN domain-containing protein [Chthoniobacterales bacterium]|nr:PIN domain-containing protein [Chthoniobacterales bacterium]